MTISEQIQKIRTLRGLTQEEVAARSGVPIGFYRELEAKPITLSDEAMESICRVLHIPYNFLQKQAEIPLTITPGTTRMVAWFCEVESIYE